MLSSMKKRTKKEIYGSPLSKNSRITAYKSQNKKGRNKKRNRKEGRKARYPTSNGSK